MSKQILEQEEKLMRSHKKGAGKRVKRSKGQKIERMKRSKGQKIERSRDQGGNCERSKEHGPII